MRRSAKEVRYVGATPLGYKSKSDSIGKPSLVPIEMAKSIKLAFELIETGLYSQSDVRRKLEKGGVVISRSSLSRVLSNPIYMGFVKSKKHKDEPEQLIKGIHQAIITEDIFLKVQLTTKRRKNKKLVNKTGSIEQYPLRGLMVCNKCGKNLTASSSKCNGGKHYYYHCFDDSKNSISTENVHKTVKRVLSTMSVDEEIKNLYLQEFENEYGKKKKDEKTAKVKSEKKISALKKKLTNVQDLFIEGSLSKEDYNQITDRYKLDLVELNASLEETPSVNHKELKEHITWGFGFVENLAKYYEQGTIEAKRLIIGLMFPEKFTFEKNQLQTNLLGDVFLLLCNGSRGLKRIKKRDNSKNLNLSRLVTKQGFEPRTSTAVMSCTIQLCYLAICYILYE